MKILFLVTTCIFIAGISAAGSLTDNGDGTITDNGTQLIWQKEHGGYMVWEDGISYCENLVLPNGSHDDWRLPNIKELVTLYDYKPDNVNMFQILFNSAGGNAAYWSSSSRSGAAFLIWPEGNTDLEGKEYSRFVRCVRGG